MPIEVKFLSYDKKGVAYQLQPVMPGETQGWEDHSSEAVRFILAQCHEFDIGARVYSAGEEDIEGEEVATENVIAELLPGFPYEEDIVDHEGEHGRLVIQHVVRTPDGGSLVQSYN